MLGQYSTTGAQFEPPLISPLTGSFADHSGTRPEDIRRLKTHDTQCDIGFGRCPGPSEILSSLFARLAPGLMGGIRERTSIRRSTTLVGVNQTPDTHLRAVRAVNYTSGSLLSEGTRSSMNPLRRGLPVAIDFF